MATPFGKAVRKMRIECGVILKDMAAALGVSSAYLSAVENGNKRITDRHLQDVVKYFQGMDEVKQEEIDTLEELVDFSQPDCSIELMGRNDRDRELAVAFARKFSDLSGDKKDSLRKLLME